MPRSALALALLAMALVALPSARAQCVTATTNSNCQACTSAQSAPIVRPPSPPNPSRLCQIQWKWQCHDCLLLQCSLSCRAVPIATGAPPITSKPAPMDTALGTNQQPPNAAFSFKGGQASVPSAILLTRTNAFSPLPSPSASPSTCSTSSSSPSPPTNRCVAAACGCPRPSHPQSSN